jgi:hypothetical protein
MKTKKPCAPLPRYSVERMGDQFVILDSVDFKFEPFKSRAEAQRECDLCNGVSMAAGKSIEPAPIIRQVQETGVTPEQLDSYGADCDRADTSGGLPPKRAQQLIERYREWLPQLLRAWANEVAEQCGYGGEKRSAWYSYLVINEINKSKRPLTFKTRLAASIQSGMWPTNNLLLPLHYLSPDAVRIKTSYFGLSESAYKRQLDLAHREFARRWVDSNSGGQIQVYPWEDSAGNPIRDDDYQCGLDAADRANLRPI